MMNTKDNFERDLNIFAGNKIKEFRKKKKLTQKQLGKLIDKSDNTISNYEKGLIALNQDVLFSLAEALDVKVDDFFPQKVSAGSLHQAVATTDENLTVGDMAFLKELMDYIKSLDETERRYLMSNIEMAVEIFKKNRN
ncbi:helix-turn-helix domain-containing protein [Lysinibacillus odysseyi]|nr:helix-turn-helix transcriptional regulator [Lysinibacillus odysseyi]